MNEIDKLFDTSGIIKTQQKIRVSIIRRKFTKVITIITGFDKDTNTEELCREMKRSFGVGGTVKEGNIEIQGNNKQRAEEFLKKSGYNILEG